MQEVNWNDLAADLELELVAVDGNRAAMVRYKGGGSFKVNRIVAERITIAIERAKSDSFGKGYSEGYDDGILDARDIDEYLP